jgi:hypothetical protein
MSPLASCSIPSSPTALARLPGLASSAVCLPPAPSRSCPSSNSWSTRITSVFFCLLRDDRPVSLYKKLKYRSYDHLDLPTLQQIHELRGERVHFLVPLGEPPSNIHRYISLQLRLHQGNKPWFEETGIPTSQITELDWWDVTTLPTHPGSHQELKFVCTPAQHTSGT